MKRNNWPRLLNSLFYVIKTKILTNNIKYKYSSNHVKYSSKYKIQNTKNSYLYYTNKQATDEHANKKPLY